MRQPLAIFFALAAAGCGPSPFVRADATRDADGKRFAAPAPDRAALYVVSPRYGGVEISLGQRSVGLVAEKGWIRVDVRPGTYTIRCQFVALKDGGARMEIELRAGQIAYVSSDYVPLGAPSCRLTPETVAAGQAQVLAARRMQEFSDPND
mgnify:CR=1 FL=1